MDPTSPTARLCDLMKQGFMRAAFAPAPRPKKPEAPIVTCYACLNWHRKGQHTAPADVRRANLAEARRKGWV